MRPTARPTARRPTTPTARTSPRPTPYAPSTIRPTTRPWLSDELAAGAFTIPLRTLYPSGYVYVSVVRQICVVSGYEHRSSGTLLVVPVPNDEHVDNLLL